SPCTPRAPTPTPFPYTTLFRSPVITRDGRTIVFSMESTSAAPRIYAIDADGSNLRAVTEGTGETDPSISADGQMLAYLARQGARSEEHTSELQSRENLVCRLLL